MVKRLPGKRRVGIICLRPHAASYISGQQHLGELAGGRVVGVIGHRPACIRGGEKLAKAGFIREALHQIGQPRPRLGDAGDGKGISTLSKSWI
jgi:hypothetical protein